MKIFLAIIIILILLLFYSVKLIYSIELNNFDFSARITLKFPFSKEIYDTGTPKKKKDNARKKSLDKPKKKIGLKTLRELKEPAFNVISKVCKIIKKHCRIVNVETKAKAALEDPMENGIAFGIISGVLNVITLILKEKCRIKNVKLEILSDFDSGEGLIFKSCGTLRLRPVLLIFVILFNFKLIKEIKNISDILKREENENG